MKTCSKCKIKKDVSLFYKDTHTADKLNAWCKNCHSEWGRELKKKRGIPDRRTRLLEELPTHKVCTRCKKEKQKSDFSIKKENDKYWTLVPTCKKCSSEISKIYYEKKKNDPDFKLKNSERVKKYANKNIDAIKNRRSLDDYKKKHAVWNLKHYYKVRDLINEKQKLKRQTERYKANRKRYIQNNKDKISQQEANAKLRYHVKNRDAITDTYVISQLVNQRFGTREEIANNLELIEIKRSQILLKRIKLLMKSRLKDEIQ